jgi:[ribosomal protein S18]-alanine N-acetyltransferase
VVEPNQVPQIAIRPGRAEDFNELWRIDQECFEPGISYSREELAHYMGRRGAFTLVAESGTRILGFLVAETARFARGHVITIDVRAEARRHGAGTQLMQAAEDQLRGKCSAVYLETAVNNLGAIRFYKRHGYSVLRTIPRYYQGRLDALLMGKELV